MAKEIKDREDHMKCTLEVSKPNGKKAYKNMLRWDVDNAISLGVIDNVRLSNLIRQYSNAQYVNIPLRGLTLMEKKQTPKHALKV